MTVAILAHARPDPRGAIRADSQESQCGLGLEKRLWQRDGPPRHVPRIGGSTDVALDIKANCLRIGVV